MRNAVFKTASVPGDPVTRSAVQLGAEMRDLEEALDHIVRSTVALIPEVSLHLIGSGGKRVRPMLLLLVAQATGGDLAGAVRLAMAAELLHNATLLHDDVVDRGHLRRGVRAAPVVYGNSASVLVGDFLLAKGFGEVVSFGDIGLLEHLSRMVAAMAEGEVLQLIRSGRSTLSLPNYQEIIAGKTAGLFSWCCRAGASLSPQRARYEENAARFGQAFGMAFQITDDIIDYTATQEESGKDLASDLRQGKTTLPLLLACEENPSILQAVEALGLDEEEPNPAQCQALVEQVLASGGIRRSVEWAQRFLDEALGALEILPAGEARECLAGLARYVVERIPARGQS